MSYLLHQWTTSEAASEEGGQNNKYSDIRDKKAALNGHKLLTNILKHEIRRSNR